MTSTGNYDLVTMKARAMTERRVIDPAEEIYCGGWREECDHEEYNEDILTGRRRCFICGHSWWAPPRAHGEKARAEGGKGK